MRASPGKLEGLLVIQPDVFDDSRGRFLETYNRHRYTELGIDVEFVQDNLSVSCRRTLRGLHFQNPRPQGKLVGVLEGEVLDVTVDIRLGSPTFGRWESLVLSSDNHLQIFIPPGFAHGFLVRSRSALFHYKCTDFYSAPAEVAIRWNDPDLGIAWALDAFPASPGPLEQSSGSPLEPILSPKDAAAPFLRELPRERLFQY